MRLRSVLLVLLAIVLALPATAGASQLIGRNAKGVRLQVNAGGQALITFTSKGKRQKVLAWNAVNAISSTAERRQVAFRVDYAGGWGVLRRDASRGFPNVCGRYRGPALAWLVTACTAPDGSHWALQSWQRTLPNYGLDPRPDQRAWELRLSHWTGELAELTVKANWAYRRYDHLFGTFTYRGAPVHGFASTSKGNPLDSFGRNLYVDTLNSAYGPGWRRENSFLVHKGTGTFCYGFYAHGGRPAGNGERYRATIIGPGVTPDVMWTGLPLGGYDQALDLELAEQQRSLYGGDTLCKPV